MTNEKDLLETLTKFGQEHIFKYINDINEREKALLLEDVTENDFALLDFYYKRMKQQEEYDLNNEIDSLMKPVPNEAKGSYDKSTNQQINDYELKGFEAISNGEAAVLLLAGGQGTRLGVTYPKGMYSVGLLSGKPLYQLQAERLIRLKQLADRKFPNHKYNKSIPWYIMTSDYTQEATNDFFVKNNHFGLDKENIIFFEQFMLPCLTRDGKVIMDEKFKISKAPDGNGGLYRAVKQKNIIDDMVKRGIKYIHIYCVDNILVRMCDPVFIGFCIVKGADCAAKVVRKTDPDEKVGVICKVNDRYKVVEYSEISQITRNLRDDNGELLYNAGSICNHFITTEFLEKICNNHEVELKHHIAEKKIPYIDENGARISPKSNNGIKLEKFVFDVFPFSDNFAIWEVPREEEFSPLKNSDESPKDSPTSCRNDLSAQHTRWIEKAGSKIIQSDPNETRSEIEISPLVSYGGEDLEVLLQNKSIKRPFLVELDKVNNSMLLNGLKNDEYFNQA